MKLNTRIAPSPTGHMHIGTARTAYFNYLAARATGGRFILRIDDTDSKRSNEEFTKVIFDTMEWLGLDYDEVHFQSDRLDTYKIVLSKMLKLGTAKMMADAIVTTDTFAQSKGDVNVVLLKSDGYPSYHFASVVDDWFMNINHIIRGTDHESNLPKHIFLWGMLCTTQEENKPFPEVVHVGLIHKDKKKMSKRDGASSLMEYKNSGYHPEAILNFLLRMGWGPKVDDKTSAYIDRARALELFIDGGSTRKAPSNYDQAKLDHFNKWYHKRDKLAA